MENKTLQRLIIVSNRLPFQLKKVNSRIEMRQSDGGLVSALKSYFENVGQNDRNTTVWIGSAEFSERRWQKFNKKKDISLDFDTFPIFFEKKLYNKYYNGFCNAVGDDKTDEDMFRALPDDAYSVKIGPGNTMAQFHFPDHREVLRMLHGFLSEVPADSKIG
jgi:hypothetical protein